MAATLEELRRQIEELRREYQDLTGRPAALFDVNNIDQANAAIRTLDGSIDDATRSAQDLEKGFGGVYSEIQGILSELSKSENATNKVTKAFKGIERVARDLKDDQQGFNKLSIKELQTRQKKLISAQAEAITQAAIVRSQYEGGSYKADELLLDERGRQLSDEKIKSRARELGITEQQLRSDAEILGQQKNGFRVIEETNQLLQDRIDKENRINESLGLGGAILGSMKGALDKLGMGGLADKLGFDDAQDKMRELTEELTNGGETTLDFAGKTKVLGAGFKNMGANLLKNLKDPLSIGLMIVNQLVDALFKVDKLTGETAKNLGMSYDQANAMVTDMTTIANLSGDTRINTEGLVKSQLALSKALGTNSQISGELLVDFTKLTEQAGFSVEAMTNLTMISQGTGKSLQENTSELLGQAKAFNINNGLALNEKELVEAVANTSAATVLTFGKQTGKLIENVAAAKQFGVNLQQAQAISDSLLNFQSSIESEMEAELLTGKQLNLEQARLLALKGETGKAAAEVLKQVGSSAEFGEMNVLAQEALAKSMGMTRDELAKSLIEREALAKIGMEDLTAQEAYNKLKKEGLSDDEIAKKLGDENLANQLKSETVQERFTAATAKLQEAFVSIAEPILAILSPLLDIVSSVLPVINLLLMPITGAFKMIAGLVTSLLEPLQGIFKPIISILQPIMEVNEVLQDVIGTLLKASPIITGIQSLFTSFASSISKQFEGIKKIFTGIFTLDLSMILGGFKDIAGAIFTVFASPFQAIFDMIVGAINGIISVANKIPGISIDPFNSVNFTSAVGLAEGGIVTEPTTALIGEGGEPEAVTPLSKIGDFVSDIFGNDGSASSSPSINLTPLVEQMNVMNSTLNAILNKEGTVMLDSTKVGTALSVGSYKLQ